MHTPEPTASSGHQCPAGSGQTLQNQGRRARGGDIHPAHRFRPSVRRIGSRSGGYPAGDELPGEPHFHRYTWVLPRSLAVLAAATILLGLSESAFAAACFEPQVEWTRTFNDLLDNNDLAHDVAVDSSGNTIVVGQYYTSVGGTDLLVRKYSPDGTFLWSNSYTGADGADVALSVAVDGADNIAVAGYTFVAGQGNNWLVRKYDPSGVFIWSRVYNGPKNGSDEARAVMVNASGDIVVAGVENYTGGSGNYYPVVKKYTSAGGLVWTGSDTGGEWKQVYDAALDSFGNTFAVGTVPWAASTNKGLIEKFDASGSLLWRRLVMEPGFNNVRLEGAAVNSSGNLYVAGLLGLDSSYDDVLAVWKFDSSGDMVWKSIDGPQVNASGLCISLLPNDELIAGGFVRRGFSHLDYLVVKYTTSGEYVWNTTFKLGSDGWAQVSGVAYDGSSGFVVVGAEDRDDLGEVNNWLVRRYKQSRSCMRVSASVSPSNPQSGDWFEVVLSATNNGTVDINTVTPHIQINAGAASVASIGGPVPSGPMTLTPGSWQHFTWTYSVSGAGTVSFTATATGIDSFDASTLASADSFVLPLGQVAWLESAVAASSTTLAVGQWMEFHFTVTNTGGSSAAGVTPTIQFPTGTADLELVAGPTPSGASIGAGLAQAFSWTFSVSGSGTMGFLAIANGTDSLSGAPVSSNASGTLVVLRGAILAGALALPATTVSPGDWFEAWFTVWNTGDSEALAVAPEIEAFTGDVTAKAGPVPAGPVSISAGAVQVFTWTFSVNGSGIAGFSATATGTDSFLGGSVQCSATASVASVGAELEWHLATAPSPVKLGGNVRVDLTVTNVGGGDANGVDPGNLLPFGPGQLGSIVGPTPPAGQNILSGQTVVFSWTLSGLAAGNVFFSWTIVGSDVSTGVGLSIPSVTMAPVAVVLPASLAARVSVPAGVVAGDWFDLILTVTNTGEVGAALTAASVLDSSAGTVVSRMSGPSPGVPLPIGPGASQAFVWTYSANGVGVINFTSTASGTDSTFGDPVSAVVSSNSLIVVADPSELPPPVTSSTSAVMSGEFTLPLGVVVGDWFSVVLTVSNAGQAYALAVSPVIGRSTGPSLVAEISGPVPPAGIGITAGMSQQFVWTYSASGVGAVSFTGTVSATDQPSGGPVSGLADGSNLVVLPAGSGGPPVSPPGRFAVSNMDVPVQVRLGDQYRVTITVSHTGGANIVNVAAVLTLSDALKTRIVGGPSPSSTAVLQAGAASTFEWQLVAEQEGSVVLSVLATGMSNGFPVSSGGQVGQRIEPRFDEPIVTYPNPVSGDVLFISLRLAGPVEWVEIDIYNGAFLRIYKGRWKEVYPVDGLFRITGVSKWAPGIYHVRARGRGHGGTKLEFKKKKVMVKR